jgi:hypothetical protein
MRRYVSLEEALLLLPRLEAIASRSVQLHQLLRRRAEALTERGCTVNAELLASRSVPAALQGSEPLLAEARGLYQALLEAAQQLTELGAEPKGPDLVDLWSLLDGREEVLLCWKLGEPTIAWYHSAQAGFAGRQSVSGRRFVADREG